MNFCIQYNIFQHFPKLQISVKLKKFCKILQKFCGFLEILVIIKFCKNCEKVSKFLQNFAIFAEICKICSREEDFLVDFEKCWKMRIWTRKSALIQPRTSLGKSDVSWQWSDGQLSWMKRVTGPAALVRPSPAHPGCTATTHHSFRGLFSAGSTPIFATKASFCCIFRDLQENHLLASKFCKFLQKVCTKIVKFLQNFDKFWQICKICNFFRNPQNDCKCLQYF